MIELLRTNCFRVLVGVVACAPVMRADAAPPKRSTISLVSEPSADSHTPNAGVEKIALPAAPPIPPQDNNPAPVSEPAKIELPDTPPQLFPHGMPTLSTSEHLRDSSAQTTTEANGDEDTSANTGESSCTTPTENEFDRYRFFGLRHSAVDGRNAGMGKPLVGTSWLNRPYYFGIDLGTVWVSAPPEDDISRDADMYGGIFAGYDWDYYWGSEIAIQRATPELKNENTPHQNRGDRLLLWNANMMYYPWGDSYYRPYWRLGIGEMEVDYPQDDGHRHDEDLWAIPIGIGIKYPVRRWLAARAEFTDEIGLGNTGVNTQHDFTLTFALEWRFGARPHSYWPWNPSRKIW